MIKGITIKLYEKNQTGENEWGEPIYGDPNEISVDNVLVAPASAEDIVNSETLYGKKAVYTLGIPKSDTHNWEDTEVEFFGQRWKTFGIPLEGIDDLIPLEWNKKVTVERYE